MTFNLISLVVSGFFIFSFYFRIQKRKFVIIHQKLTQNKVDNSNLNSKEKDCKEPINNSSKHFRQNIPKSVRIKVWETHIGRFYEGKCYVCSKTIDVNNFHTAHVIAYKKGGITHVENLRPTCVICNLSAGTQNLDEFAAQYYGKNNKK